MRKYKVSARKFTDICQYTGKKHVYWQGVLEVNGRVVEVTINCATKEAAKARAELIAQSRKGIDDPSN